MIRTLLALAVLSTFMPPLAAAQGAQVHVVLETSAGEIELALDAGRAPVTVANFLRYVDGKHYDNGRFHRAVRLDNQVRKDVVIEVIQGGMPAGSKPFEPITLERTRDTGLKHVDGALSMARDGADTARGDFFICIGDQPSLDFGGARNPDGQGFAAFGRVVRGMDVVRKIQAGRTNEREQLVEPIAIVRAYRR